MNPGILEGILEAQVALTAVPNVHATKAIGPRQVSKCLSPVRDLSITHLEESINV